MGAYAGRVVDAVVTRPAVSVLATVAGVVVLMTLGGVTLAGRTSEAVGHALSHVFVAGPVALLGVLAIRSWPPPAPSWGRLWGRRVALLGIVGIAAGQVLEILGARVDEPDATAIEAVAHTVGMIVTTLSLLTAATGGSLALLAAARDHAVPRWVAGVVVLLVAAALTFLIVGAPGS